ncbi:hypothetical protein QBC38DRAFT_34136 [Podospora fimiseda]|uniref:Uncharacterized protein n=1 Tax=Podospora fimiseda TaxID=252190 RepID=A0AAN7BIR4_9PEZI|nr:hypothetical protein QBC38DRAFT_34136 [Podospora fimiseda]
MQPFLSPETTLSYLLGLLTFFFFLAAGGYDPELPTTTETDFNIVTKQEIEVPQVQVECAVEDEDMAAPVIHHQRSTDQKEVLVGLTGRAAGVLLRRFSFRDVGLRVSSRQNLLTGEACLGMAGLERKRRQTFVG